MFCTLLFEGVVRLQNRTKCPNCDSYEFNYTGIQTFNKPIRKNLDLWTCNNCHSTISTERRKEKRIDLSFVSTSAPIFRQDSAQENQSVQR